MKKGKSIIQLMAMASVALGILRQDGLAQNEQKPGEEKWRAPASANRKVNPVPQNESSITTGKEFYEIGCVPCHGSKGHGDGPAATSLEQHPGVLSDPKMWEQSDGELYWKITEGKSPMPNFAETFSEEQRWQIVNFIRTLAPKPASAVAPDAGQARVEKSDPVAERKTEKESSPAQATKTPATDSQFVTREEYDTLLHELTTIKETLKVGEERSISQTTQTDAEIGEVQEELSVIKKLADSIKPGTSKFLVTGYGFAGFTDLEGENSSFNAGFNPILLWKLNDRLFFEGEMELELEDGETHVGLEYAQLNYLFNDYVTLGAGKFLSPFGIFRERLHPAWINKLPDAPLGFGHDGLVPGSNLGFQIRGGIPAGPTKLNYTAYISNGPRLNLGDDEPEEAGVLHFDNDDNFADSKAFGSRIGFLPLPELEIGYSLQYSRLNPEGASIGSVNSYIHGPYLSYVRDSALLRGSIDLRSEWIWSKVDNVTYDADGSLGFGPLRYNNRRDSGYVQLAYRPSKINHFICKNLEAVGRWDMFNRPSGAPESVDERRWTLGLNYWLSPTTILKAAYQFGEQREAGESKEHVDGFLFQAAMGF